MASHVYTWDASDVCCYSYVNDLIRFDNVQFGKCDQDSFFNADNVSPSSTRGQGDNGHSVAVIHGVGPQQVTAQGAGLFSCIL